MNAAQKWIILGFALGLISVICFRPWQQTFKGAKLVYGGELGHHPIWRPPQPTGEKSWQTNAPASECEVAIESGVVLRQTGIVAGITAVLLFAFRKWPNSPVKKRELVLTSLALALCLPVLSSNGIPLIFYVILAPISLFMESGHLGPWFVPMIAGISLIAYSSLTFLLLTSIVWFAHRLVDTSRSS
jgi:hypothetical protein